MSPRRTLTPFCAALLFLSPVAAQAEEPSPEIEALRACVAARAETLDFSGAVLISRKGQTMTYARGAQSDGAPITSRSRFNIGSAGKMFTAVAVGQLVEKGQIDLDAPIGRYVDGLTAEASNVTVRQLLTHSSGSATSSRRTTPPRSGARRPSPNSNPLSPPMRPPSSRALGSPIPTAAFYYWAF